eukprot:6981984-Prymnesium_polylepis.1
MARSGLSTRWSTRKRSTRAAPISRGGLTERRKAREEANDSAAARAICGEDECGVRGGSPGASGKGPTQTNARQSHDLRVGVTLRRARPGVCVGVYWAVFVFLGCFHWFTGMNCFLCPRDNACVSPLDTVR